MLISHDRRTVGRLNDADHRRSSYADAGLLRHQTHHQTDEGGQGFPLRAHHACPASRSHTWSAKSYCRTTVAQTMQRSNSIRWSCVLWMSTSISIRRRCSAEVRTQRERLVFISAAAFPKRASNDSGACRRGARARVPLRRGIPRESRARLGTRATTCARRHLSSKHKAASWH